MSEQLKEQKIKKLLISNRGEIACRVIHTAKLLGIKTVALFTPDEKNAKHVQMADEAFSLGEGVLGETYLNKQKIISIARESGAEAIHPGYGFLSENAEFCELVEKAGIIFVGPTSEHIRLMGDKIMSKTKMQEISVPVIPGYNGNDQSAANLKKQAKIIGFPVLIKATAGGGGKGMRIVHKEEDFSASLESAKSEALSSFSNGDVLIEKFITKPRHIEVQMMSDTHENHLHFYERECSIQRRYQKIIEETPSVALTPEIRESICTDAVKITSAINYRGAATVEFILDEDGSYYFLEMNTRLQVEHPITEEVTGVDLVAMQILVAEGKKLPYEQEKISQRGHSIECRIYAEDPENNFFPTTGKIFVVGKSDLPGVRLDSGIQNGDEVTVNYDPMIAKLIVHAENRGMAISKMQKALNDYPFLGLKNNRLYLKKVLGSEAFKEGETWTNFIDEHPELFEQCEKRNFPVENSLYGMFCGGVFKKTNISQSNSSVEEFIEDELQKFRN
tara:strand:+ start:2016 stop:3530 length:1515 start_codon:yes stop_codon:yes gene_type:complete